MRDATIKGYFRRGLLTVKRWNMDKEDVILSLDGPLSCIVRLPAGPLPEEKITEAVEYGAARLNAARKYQAASRRKAAAR